MSGPLAKDVMQGNPISTLPPLVGTCVEAEHIVFGSVTRAPFSSFFFVFLVLYWLTDHGKPGYRCCL